MSAVSVDWKIHGFYRRLESALDANSVAMKYADDSQWFIDKFKLVEVLILLEYLFMLSICLALALYLRRSRYIALAGDSSAARKILLPAYEPLLWLLGCTVGIYTAVMTLLVAFGWFPGKSSHLMLEVFYSMGMFLFTLVIIFLLQKSVSLPALRRSVMITFALALYSLPIYLLLLEYVEPGAPNVAFAVMSTARAFILIPFGYVCARPPARASKRTLREYCVFIFTYFVVHFSSKVSFHLDGQNTGFGLTYATAIGAVAFPIIVWRVLKADTEFWRGLGQRAVELQALFLNRNSIDERLSSQGLHVLIEMHRKLIIDFAHLQLQNKIGVGSSAVVFNGILHPGTPVAIKVYTPTTFSDETVAEFSQEAALCGALHHPNIVKFYGMCVYPPTICLVSELCQGTLEDITCTAHVRFADGGLRFCNRQQMLLNVCYMLDAARAVAHLHSFSPPFLHRDIKPANFLVDVQGRVKLTDFGESRSLARFHSAGTRRDTSTNDEFSSYSTHSSSSPPELRMTASSFPKMTVKGTVDYMAPEIINGKAGLATYGEAADVYSLAVTMWDVLYPGTEKFPDLKNNHLQIFANVIEGKRPRIESHASGGHLHPSLQEIIALAWHHDPQARPTACTIVKVLENVHEELLAAFATKLLPELCNDMSSSVNRVHKGTVDLFPGELIIARMQDMHYIQSPSEALRLGSAFMDAGLLHHVKHSCGFENTSLKYFFDEYHIRLCQPLRSSNFPDDYHSNFDDDLEHQQARGLSSTVVYRGSFVVEDHNSMYSNPTCSKPLRFVTGSHSEVARPSSREGSNPTGWDSCRCQKLGQRFESSKAFRRQRLRRKVKLAMADDIQLTTKLLEGETSSSTPKLSDSRHSMDDFDFVGLDVQAA